MANKQKVFKQLTEIAKEYASLSGTSYDGFSESFYRTNTANDMILRIEQFEHGIARVKHEKAIEKWYGTDDGAKWYKTKKDRLDEAKKTILLGNKELIGKLNKIIGDYSVQRELLTREKFEIQEELRNPPVQIEE